MLFRRTVVLIVLAALPLCAEKKSKGVPMARLPNQKAEIANLKLPDPAQKCTNYAWAVAVEEMLKLQHVPLDQHFWVDKADGGELCIEPLPGLDHFADPIDGTYMLDDGRRVTLHTTVIKGGPSIPEDALAPLKRGMPVLVFWNSRIYVLHSATYDEFIYPNGQRMYLIRKLEMLDPLATGKEREVSFINGTDDASGLSALIFVSATFAKHPQWQTTTDWH